MKVTKDTYDEAAALVRRNKKKFEECEKFLKYVKNHKKYPARFFEADGIIYFSAGARSAQYNIKLETYVQGEEFRR